MRFLSVVLVKPKEDVGWWSICIETKESKQMYRVSNKMGFNRTKQSIPV